MRSPSSRISPPAMRPGGSSRPMTASAGQRLAGARLADHAQHLALGDVEGDAVDRASVPRRVGNSTRGRTSRGRVGSAERHHRSFGLRASRSQSPSRLTESTSTASAMPGKMDDPPLAREQELVADPDQGAERGHGRRHADAEEGQRRLGDDGEAEVDGGDHQHRAHHVGQHVADHDGARQADHARACT